MPLCGLLFLPRRKKRIHLTAHSPLVDNMVHSHIAPIPFLTVPPRCRSVGKFYSAFVGYEQHDAFELLMVLLDALHEDTNRVTLERKPYFERISYREAFAMPDVLLAREELRRELARNQSRVYDTCLGQLACRLTCCLCGAMSRSFEPYTTVSLPVPSSPVASSSLSSSPSSSSSSSSSSSASSTIIHGSSCRAFAPTAQRSRWKPSRRSFRRAATAPRAWAISRSDRPPALPAADAAGSLARRRRCSRGLVRVVAGRRPRAHRSP